jgi:NADPH:quinone reductase-like Zn-dependent oxidoreductase
MAVDGSAGLEAGRKNMALKPKSLSHGFAASVLIGALTAWQGFLDSAKMHSGEHALIHGAAGAVGLLAVQLAHLYGAYVISIASAANRDFVKQLGADKVIDYNVRRFEDEARNVDIVFDAVGGDTVDLLGCAHIRWAHGHHRRGQREHHGRTREGCVFYCRT